MPSFDTGSAFTIEELTGQRRSVRLVDRALPYRPFTLETGQRVEVEWNPGYATGTANVMGAQEMETSINGAWKDIFLGGPLQNTTQGTVPSNGQLTPFTVNGGQVATARGACDLMDSIAREGQLLQVTWDEDVRNGYLSSFVKNWDNRHDVKWSMKFLWISRGEPTAPTVLASQSSVSSAATALSRSVQALKAASVPTFPTSPVFLGAVGGFISVLDGAVNTMQGAVSNVAAVALSPVDAARGAATACAGAITASVDLIATINQAPYAVYNETVAVGQLTVGQQMAAAQYARDMINQARQSQRIAAENQAALIRQIQGTLLGVYAARQGDDLRTVSKIYYDTPFEWRRLMVFNQLSGVELRPNQIVLVPKITAGDRSSVNA